MRFTAPLAIATFAFAAPSHAQDLATSLQALKSAPSEKALHEQLLAIGFSRGLLDKAAKATGFDDAKVLATANVKRAESWSVNVDADPDNESVVQVWFQPKDLQGMEFQAVYLLLVLDAPSSGNKVLWEHLYDLAGCTYSSEKTMTLSFPAAKGKPWKEIRFAIDEATSCGTYVEITSRKDVLALDGKAGQLKLSTGKGKKSGVDRMEHLRE